MYIERIPNRSSPPAILLRESFREGKKVRKRTVANLSGWPPERIEAMRIVLRGGTAIENLADAFEITRTRPHGHVASVLGSLRRVGLDRIIASERTAQRDRALAMIVARLIEPDCSKLATTRGLADETLFSTLGEILGVRAADEDDLYEAMDWLLAGQQKIEAALAVRHLTEGTLILYDVTSTYFEGRTCRLAHLGHNRDGKKDKLQIVFGLLTNGEGCPVAVEVFEGNVGDPKTLGAQVGKIRQRFHLERVVLVGDRGMITEARIRNDLRAVEGLDWITALRAPAIQKLVESGSLQLWLFDQRDLAEITDPAYPGERLIVCRNPLLASERARKREELLRATARDLDKIVEATRRNNRRLQGKAEIGMRVGKVLGRFKMGKHFRVKITEATFRYERNPESIAREAALDGIYVIRTSVGCKVLGADDSVRAYKRLSAVERAFRSLKTVDVRVRPIYHRLADRVRAHVFLCMLAYYVEWHMRKALAPILFDDEDKAAAEKLRPSVVAPARRSIGAERKARTKRTEQDGPVHSFRSLLKDLATLAKNRIEPKIHGALPFDQYTTPTPLQQRAFDLLRVSYRM